jgi:subtilisin family serine protease
LRKENRILDTYDFVDKKENVYDADNHGTMVLSTMTAEVDGKYVGTHQKLHIRYIDRRQYSETPKELMYWVQVEKEQIV